jgi:RHS repeat-associated protein
MSDSRGYVNQEAVHVAYHPIIDYDEFGRVVAESGTAEVQPFRFAGGLYDPDTKLVRFGGREYDAETGRWLEREPVLFGGVDANLYAYALNDPVNIIDRNGRIPGPTGLVGGAIAGAIGSFAQSEFDGGSFWQGVEAAAIGGTVGGATGYLFGETAGALAGQLASSALQGLLNDALNPIGYDGGDELPYIGGYPPERPSYPFRPGDPELREYPPRRKCP